MTARSISHPRIAIEGRSVRAISLGLIGFGYSLVGVWRVEWASASDRRAGSGEAGGVPSRAARSRERMLKAPRSAEPLADDFFCAADAGARFSFILLLTASHPLRHAAVHHAGSSPTSTQPHTPP